MDSYLYNEECAFKAASESHYEDDSHQYTEKETYSETYQSATYGMSGNTAPAGVYPSR